MPVIFKLIRTLSVVLLVTVLSVFAFADTIKLKDGSTIKGKILSFSNGQFIILIGAGERQRQLTFYADEVESIEFDSSVSARNADNRISQNEGPNFSTEQNGNSTIITVGAKSKTADPQPLPPAVSNPQADPVRTDAASMAKPIQIKVKVLADNTANGWTNAGWVVKKGQRIKIFGKGRISLGAGRYSGPEGLTTLRDEKKLISDKPTGALIAVIGDDNNDFIFVGEGLEFEAKRDGALFLGVNEGLLNDNSGSFEVMVEIDPAVT